MGKTVERVLVTNATGANTGTSLATIVSGDMLIFNRTMGTALTGTPTLTSADGNDQIYIAQGLGSEGSMTVLLSFPIMLKNVTKASLSTYVAPVEKVQTITFPTTINSRSEYNLTIVYNNPTQRVLQQRPQAERYSYVTSTAATQAELAFALANFAGNDKYSNITRKVEVNATGTFLALASGNTAGVTNLSKVVNSVAHGLTAGTYLRIGGTTATTPVYKVESSLTTDSFKLTEKYQGPTATIANANIGTLTATSAFNLVITGLPIPANNLPDLYDKVNFDSTLFEVNGPVIPDFTVTNTANLNMGVGQWQQVRDKEYLSSGYLGVQNRTMFPGNQFNPPTHTVVGNTYDLFTIEHFETVSDGNGMSMRDNKTTTIAFYNGATTKRVAFIAVMESLLESAGTFVQ